MKLLDRGSIGFPKLTNVESIRVHPEADAAFMETVKAVVEQYAPTLIDRVAWSDMNAARPEFPKTR